MTPKIPDYSQMLEDDFISNLNLDDIFSVVPAFESEIEMEPVTEEAELKVAKTVVATAKQQSASQI